MGTSAANSVLTTDPTLVHGGTNALALGTGSATRAQDITSSIQSGQTYELEFWTKVKTPGIGTDSIGVTFYSGTTNIGSFYRSFRNTEYGQSRFDFVAPVAFDRAVLWASK